VVPKQKEVQVLHTKTAAEMMKNARLHLDYDIAVMAAAVADFTPVNPSSQKIKKEGGEELTINLKRTEDILATFGNEKKRGQILVGFALETENEKSNALKKLNNKNADLIVLNTLQDEGAGFGGSTNKVTIFGKENFEKAFPVKTKEAVAVDIVDAIINLIK